MSDANSSTNNTESQVSPQETSVTETVIHVHDAKTFYELVNSGLTVVDYSATWCGPCRRIAPYYEALSREYTAVIPELKFIKVDLDELQEVAVGVSGLPTFQFYLDGTKIDSLTFMGASVDKLNNAIVDFLRGNYTMPAAPSVSEQVKKQSREAAPIPQETTQGTGTDTSGWGIKGNQATKPRSLRSSQV